MSNSQDTSPRALPYLRKLPGYHRIDGRAYAECPVCGGKLTISRGRDGRIELDCANGCAFRAIVAKMGLKTEDFHLDGAREPQPPYDYDLARAINGAAIVDRDIFRQLALLLRSYDFYPSDGTIWDAACALVERGGELDEFALVKYLQQHQLLELAGGELKVRGLSTNVPPDYLQNAEQWARQFLADAESRAQIALGQAKTNVGYFPLDAQYRAEMVRAQAHLDDIQRRQRGEESTSGWQPAVQSLQALMAKELPEVRWAVEEIIGEGVTLLAAKPKKGKTVLMLQIALCIALGTKALGGYAATVQGEVLFLALEENERRMQRRVRKLLQDADTVPDGVHLVYEWLPFDRGGIEALAHWLDEHPATILIVIDTLERVRPSRRNNGNAYAEDYSAVKDIQHFASEYHVSVVLIHHTRKMGSEDPLDEVSGSTGLTGGVDNILVMRAANGMTELHRMGRDYTENSAIALRGDPETLLWVYAGDADEVRRSDAQKAILKALQGVSDGMTPQEIADALDAPAGRIRVMLHKMMKADDGSITKENGRYFTPTNTANDANANASKSPDAWKQADSRSHDRVSGSVSALATTNGSANGRKPLEFDADSPPVSDVSSVSSRCPECGSGDLRPYGEELRCFACDELIARPGA